jgi:2,5-diketo-D-gluconate reductase A
MTHTLADGTTLPDLGFGTYPLKGDEGVDALVSAIEVGYRYLDSAVNYENEREVGEAVRRASVPREQLRVATKIPGRFHAEELALRSLADSAERLGLERIDVGLIHWPNPSRGLFPEAWRALVRAQREGLVEHIGVSNFTEAHLRRIIDETGVVPALNQIELHPLLPQREARAYAAEHGILVQSWSPLARGRLLDDPLLARIAAKHARTPAQIVVRWHVQQGLAVIPKSNSLDRVAENLDVLGFALDDDDLAAIATLETGERTGSDPDTQG